MQSLLEKDGKQAPNPFGFPFARERLAVEIQDSHDSWMWQERPRLSQDAEKFWKCLKSMQGRSASLGCIRKCLVSALGEMDAAKMDLLTERILLELEDAGLVETPLRSAWRAHASGVRLPQHFRVGYERKAEKNINACASGRLRYLHHLGKTSCEDQGSGWMFGEQRDSSGQDLGPGNSVFSDAALKAGESDGNHWMLGGADNPDENLGINQHPGNSASTPASAAQKDKTVWHPFLAKYRKRIDDSSREVVLLINAWLNANGALLVASPLNERSLQICGDEKLLGTLVSEEGKLFGWLPLRIIGAFIPAIPLPCIPGGVEGRPLLLVENSHTFHSLGRWNQTAARYSGVAYGRGTYILKHTGAINETADLCGADGIAYFGDIDPAGMNLPMALAKKGMRIRPSEVMYAFLLARGIQRPLPDQERPNGIGDWLRGWLPGHAAEIFQLWRKKLCIPQEGLGTEQLTGEFQDFVGSAAFAWR